MEYWVPSTKGQLIDWLTVIYPKKNWAKMPKKQLYAVYFQIRNGSEKGSVSNEILSEV